MDAAISQAGIAEEPSASPSESLQPHQDGAVAGAAAGGSTTAEAAPESCVLKLKGSPYS